ncbi:MAG: hypothetical protein EHM58_04475 [Ignavibacteriae bacterium]|nr:MAG: hypothetical protein EHM58_04475 [Ignavibacteriota bacterium]
MPVLNKQNTINSLGEIHQNCRWINYNGKPKWTCFNWGGGTSFKLPGSSLLGWEPVNQQGYLNEVASNNIRIAEIQADLARNANLSPSYQYDAGTVQMLNAELARLQARNAAIMEFLNYSPAKQNTIISKYKTGSNFLETKTKSYQNTFNKINSSIPKNNPGNLEEQLKDTFTDPTGTAGLSTLSWVLILGAGGYLLVTNMKSNKKKS